jgi:hypothetical protein
VRRLVALALAAAVACGLAACGHEDKALADAQAGLAAVHKGDLDMRFTAGAGPQAAGHDVGFALQGPFDFTGPAGTLPVAKLRFTRLLGGRDRTTTFESTADQAFVERGARRVALTPAQLQGLRLGPSSSEAVGLKLSSWATGKTVQRRAGAMNKVDADVDAVRVLNDVLAMAGQFGGDVRPVQGKNADRLRQAVRTAHMTMLVGAKDGLMRSLTVDIAFAPSAAAAAKVKQALGDLAAARLHLDLAVKAPAR